MKKWKPENDMILHYKNIFITKRRAQGGGGPAH